MNFSGLANQATALARPQQGLPTAALDPSVGPQASAAVRQRQAQQPADDNAPIAPWPSIDRYPTILGSKVSLAYISSVFRMSLTGYRREYVDMLDELLERDPHMYAVVAQRVHAVSGGEDDVVPADLDADDPDKELAQQIADEFEHYYRQIPHLQQAKSLLQWGGLFYAVGASEISWRPDQHKNGPRIVPAFLHWIHSRRLAFPDPASWSVRVWDQGMVSSWDILSDPTSQLFGVKCDDFPGKFLVHTPSVRGNYPTRDGLGRELAYWSALKLMGARGAGQFIERFGKPWVVGYYATQDNAQTGDNAVARAANQKDIDALETVGNALGIGGLSYGTLPNSTKVDVFGPAVNTAGRTLMHGQFIDLCNKEMSKAVLGQSDTTDSGPNGSRGAVEVRKQGTQELYRYDASSLGATLSRLAYWYTRFNYPGKEHLAPSIVVHASEEPDPTAILDRACKLADKGAPVDADAIAEEIGVKLLPPEDGDDKGRRLYPLIPGKAADLQAMRQLESGEEVADPVASKVKADEEAAKHPPVSPFGAAPHSGSPTGPGTTLPPKATQTPTSAQTTVPKGPKPPSKKE
jgi:hypothetical protein